MALKTNDLKIKYYLRKYLGFNFRSCLFFEILINGNISHWEGQFYGCSIEYIYVGSKDMKRNALE